MKLRDLALALALALPAAHASAQSAQGTGFTFQGLLQQGGQPLTGLPDLEFRLFDSVGTPIGPVLSRPDWPVSSGQVVVDLDFGPAFNGQARFLQVTVNGTALAPSIAVSSTPYALAAQSTVAGAVNSTSIADGSIAAADVNAAAIQRRITTACATGSNLQSVNADGTATCQPDANSGGDVTAVSTPAIGGLAGGSASGDVSLAIAPGGVTSSMIGTGQVATREIADASIAGLDVQDGSIGAADVDTTQLQRRVASNCAAGSSIRAINSDGTVACESDDIGSGWALTGSAGTNPVTQFIGTSDGAALRLQAGGVGVNTPAPLAPLHVRSGTTSLTGATPDPGTVINAERATGNAFVSVMGTGQRGVLFGEPGSAADGGVLYDNGGSGMLDLRTGGNVTRLQLGVTDPDGTLGLSDHPSLLLRGDTASAYMTATEISGQQRLYLGFLGSTRSLLLSPTLADFETALEVGGTLLTGDDATILGDLSITGAAFKPGGGAWAATSDRRLKRDIEPLAGALDRLLALRGVTFEYLPGDAARRPPGRHTGFVAQEVREVFPEWVGEDSAGFLLVAPTGFEALAVEALRDLKAGTDVEVAALREENARMRADLDALRTAFIASQRGAGDHER